LLEPNVETTIPTPSSLLVTAQVYDCHAELSPRIVGALHFGVEQCKRILHNVLGYMGVARQDVSESQHPGIFSPIEGSKSFWISLAQPGTLRTSMLHTYTDTRTTRLVA